MSSIIDQHRHLTTTIRDFNESLVATLKERGSFSYLNPKNAVALNFEMDGEYVDYFVIRTTQGDYYQLLCKSGISKETAHEICEQYQVICILC